MVRVKICGITNLEDGLLACKYGADAVGFVVDVPVPTLRKITATKAKEIMASIPPFVSTVVVTMPKDITELQPIIDLNPDAIQIHSQINPNELKKIDYSGKIIKTIHVTKNALEEAKRFEFVDGILLDTKADLPGGTGTMGDLEISMEVVRKLGVPVILAGGLTPTNVREVISIVNPYGVDVSSGVEKEPGKKDPEKIKAFIRRAKYER